MHLVLDTSALQVHYCGRQQRQEQQMIWVIGGCIWFAVSIVVGLLVGNAISYMQEADDYESF